MLYFCRRRSTLAVILGSPGARDQGRKDSSEFRLLIGQRSTVPGTISSPFETQPTPRGGAATKSFQHRAHGEKLTENTEKESQAVLSSLGALRAFLCVLCVWLFLATENTEKSSQNNSVPRTSATEGLVSIPAAAPHCPLLSDYRLLPTVR